MHSRGRRRRRRPRPHTPAPESATATAVAVCGVEVTGQRIVRVQLAAVYGMASRLEHLPRWSDLWMRSDTVERRANRWMLRLRGFVAGLPAESVVRVESEPGSWIRWRQAHGTFLHYAGRFEVAPAERGEGTVLRYTVELDPGLFLLDDASTRRLMVQEVERTLDRMKWSAERELVAEEVRLMKVRPAHDTPARAAGVPESGPATPEPVLPPVQPLPEAPATTEPSRRARRRRRGRRGRRAQASAPGGG